MPKNWLMPAVPTDLAGYESLIPWVETSLRRAALLLPPDPRPLARVIGQVLTNRGIAPSDAPAYFESAAGDDNPFRLKGMSESVNRIRQAIRAGEPIAVYGDYDVDGVTSTALLVTALRALGANVTAYIPHRVDDGYGLNNDSLTQLHEQGIKLVITVDCGVRANSEADYAGAIGLDLIVTDHHAVPDVLPRATIINPKQPGCEYPFKELSGVGLAYKLAQALALADERAPLGAHPSALAPASLLDLVALGTVADIVPLRGENRSLVRRGLKGINETKRVGIRELIMKAGVPLGQVNAGTIGFGLGPRLNAAGRLEHAKLAYELLMSDDRVYAENLATRLDSVNRERQELTKSCFQHAREHADTSGPIIVAADPSYPQGVVGLIAGRLADEFYRPALVIEQGEKLSKGSARSIPEFDLIGALDEIKDVFLKHGGHRAAAGFTLETERISELKERLATVASRQFGDQLPQPSLRVDAALTFSELDRPLLFLLEQMEPFGAENASPVFAAHGITVMGHRALGKEGDHLRLTLRQGKVVREGIAFRMGKQWAGKLPQQIDLAFAFEWNEYNGSRAMQLNVKDIRPAAGTGQG
ncbi:MAG: single-stranded-DNA-specific exonuclease RecJ [Chloroflexi bacterium]|nr:single-stranded-DNA-specific exonuclease RecJ [Chloroflexota bacterium]